MGTTEEENLYKQQQEQAATQARLDFERRQQEMAERQRQQEEADRKAAEDKLVNGQGNMTADAPATVGWPDNEVEQKPQSGLGKIAGALRVGKEGDVAFARDLLNSGQAPLDSVNAGAKGADGAKEGVAGAPAAKPALGLG